MTVIERISRQSLGNIAFLPSVQDGLTGLFQPRKSNAEAAINRAPNGVNGVVTGNPVYNEFGGAFLGPEAYIETGILETISFTLISVARKNPVGGVALISTIAGSTASTPYADLNVRNSSPYRFGVGAKTTPETSREYFGYDFPAGNTGYEFMSATCDGSNFMLVMPRNPAGTVGGNPRTVALNGSRDTPTAAYRIGAARVTTSNFPNGTEHLLDIIFNRALSELEIRAIYAEARAYFAQRGIVI